jgi:hypothetical protein
MDSFSHRHRQTQHNSSLTLSSAAAVVLAIIKIIATTTSNSGSISDGMVARRDAMDDRATMKQRPTRTGKHSSMISDFLIF